MELFVQVQPAVFDSSGHCTAIVYMYESSK